MQSLIKELKKLSDPVRAKHSQGFFKTAKGEYGEGDIFLGITMPLLRTVSRKYTHLDLKDLEKLLYSKIHEHRMIALLITVLQYKKLPEIPKSRSESLSSAKLTEDSHPRGKAHLQGKVPTQSESREKIYDFYIKHSKQINNWDLVDVNVPHVVGDYLLNHDRSILYKFALSKNLWQRRISVLACFAFIRQKDFKDAIAISKILLTDKHDLIHKAVGWMLREIGKRDEKTLTDFLDTYCLKMPRTMLRYSIERLPEPKRLNYLKKK
jgi:3-methyladenine DNA glycosylase AlkD